MAFNPYLYANGTGREWVEWSPNFLVPADKLGAIMRRIIKWYVIWPVLSIVCYYIITLLPDRAGEYGPPLPTNTERIAALEEALEDHGIALEKHEAAFHFYWKRDKTMR